jgi:hypothetical protein
MLVVQEFGMVDVGMFDMRGGPLGDRQELFDARPGASLFESRQPLPQGFGDDAGHCLAGGARDLLREAMGLRILDVQAHPCQAFYQLQTLSTFLRRVVPFVYNSAPLEPLPGEAEERKPRSGID